MRFVSHQIKGKGRGKGIGFPTINLVIPQAFDLEDGVYGVQVIIDTTSYIGAMHYGPIPVFNEEEKSLEIFLLNVDNSNFPDIENKDIIVDIKKYIREIRSFPNPEALSDQIEKDVAEISKILSS